MKYIYYPGCSLEGTALEYNVSTQLAMQALGAELVELDDWTCCGATAAQATDHLISIVLAARNLALGERRASTVRDYLVLLGISANRIKTISYGEERPFALGHDESAWRLNRRSHFVITAR